VRHPRSVAEIAAIVRAEPSVKAIGSGHTFNLVADAAVQVALDRMPADVVIDGSTRTVRVSAGMRYGDLAVRLHAQGWALANLASLPHISVAGAVATGTHGSGDRLGSLATAVRGLTLVDGQGRLRTLTADHPDLPGAVVSLGALGIVTDLTLAIEPTYDVRQAVYLDVPWAGFDYADATSLGDSVSLFTAWTGDVIPSVWVKRRSGRPFAPQWSGGSLQTEDVHPTRRQPAVNTTPQCGVPGPWYERWPHFRMGFTPSTGAEIQSEYLLPRKAAAEAFSALRALARSDLADAFQRLLIIAEVRSVAADDLWLSGAYGRDTVGIHFTWHLDLEGVERALVPIEQALVPLGARPHWGKLHLLEEARLRPLYPRFDDFVRLRRSYDPDGLFDNGYLNRVLGPAGT
jgi:xylitol oxidase